MKPLMNDDSQLLTSLSDEELKALAESKLAPSARARLDELLERNAENPLGGNEQHELDRLLARVDQLTVLKARARYTLRQQAGNTDARVPMSAPNSPFGLLNINKPAGLTSRRVVDHVQRLVRPAKAGHAGTLDPLAAGVLVVCVGPATRLIDYVQRAAKRYTATFLLGRHSDTEDVEGEVTELDDPPVPTREEIDRAAEGFVGEIQQRPPAYSALKVGGRRAYDLARAGEAVELKARPVTIHGIEVLEYDYPQLQVDIRCGSGTYVRSLGRDLAESLGTAAVMSALVRTEIGPFHLDDARELDAITRESLGRLLLPARRAVESLPAITLAADELRRIGHGMAITRRPLPEGDEFAGLNPDGNLAAVLARRGNALRPVRNFRGKS